MSCASASSSPTRLPTMCTPTTGPSFSWMSLTAPAVLRIWLLPLAARPYVWVLIASAPYFSTARASVGRDRAPAHGDQKQLGVELVDALQRDPDALLGVLDAGEAGAQLRGDAAAAEGALQQLGAGLVLQRHQVRQRLDDRHLGPEG